jgi:PAB-dependent poly(A)-specific ribonuclease subunit 2
MPYYRELLLSAWPTLKYEVGRLPPKIDPDVTALLKRGEIGYYAPSSHNTRPNQVEYTHVEAQVTKSITAPKFLSEKARETAHVQEHVEGVSQAVHSLNDLVLDGANKKEVPHIYRNVEIKYSKFGVDDFDFECVSLTKSLNID